MRIVRSASRASTWRSFSRSERDRRETIQAGRRARTGCAASSAVTAGEWTSNQSLQVMGEQPFAIALDGRPGTRVVCLIGPRELRAFPGAVPWTRVARVTPIASKCLSPRQTLLRIGTGSPISVIAGCVPQAGFASLEMSPAYRGLPEAS